MGNYTRCSIWESLYHYADKYPKDLLQYKQAQRKEYIM